MPLLHTYKHGILLMTLLYRLGTGVVMVLTVVAANAAVAEIITLDFEQAVTRAQDRDPRISEKQYLAEAAKGLLKEAEGVETFIYDVNAFVALSPGLRGDYYNDDGTFNRESLEIDGVSPWYNLSFTIIKPLNTYGKVENYSKAAKNNIKIKQGDVKLERANTYIDVTRAYYGFLTARDIRKLLDNVKGKVEAAVDLVKGWLDDESGKAKHADLFALQTGVGIINRYLAEATGMEKVALAGLRMLVGARPKDELQLVDKNVKPLPLPAGGLQELQAKALKQRPEMSQVEAGLKARRALLEAKNTEKYPNVYAGVGGVLAYSPDRARTDDFAVYDPYNRVGVTPVLGVKWDWHSGVQEARVFKAQAELNALLEKKSFAQQGIPFQVAEEYYLVHAHSKMVKELYGATRAARRWMISSYADFEAGEEEAAKVMDALSAYALAHSDYLKTVNEYNIHVARLNVVTGEIQ